mgnify:CR=1 FL=1
MLDISSNLSLTSLKCTDNINLAKLWVKNDSQLNSISITKEETTLIYYNNGGINIPDVTLKEGTNTVKFALKAHTDGLKNGLYPKNGEKYRAVNEKIDAKLKDMGFKTTKTFALSGRKSGLEDIEKIRDF